MKLPEDGEKERANRTWIMTNWVEPFVTTMTRTSWPRFMESVMPTSLTFKDWLKPLNQLLRIQGCTSLPISLPTSSPCIRATWWPICQASTPTIIRQQPRSISLLSFMERQALLLLQGQTVCSRLPLPRTGRLQLLLLPICTATLLQQQQDIITDLCLIITLVMSLLTSHPILIMLDSMDANPLTLLL